MLIVEKESTDVMIMLSYVTLGSCYFAMCWLWDVWDFWGHVALSRVQALGLVWTLVSTGFLASGYMGSSDYMQSLGYNMYKLSNMRTDLGDMHKKINMC